MSKRTIGCLALVIIILCLSAGFVYRLPPIYDRLGWRVESFISRLRYAINPPAEQVFQPGGEVGSTLPPLNLPTATATSPATATATVPGPTPTPSPTPTPTFTPTPLPAQAMLNGITHMYQRYNNCGPANLAMALSFWGWQGTQQDTADYLKPNARDKNVMPYEMELFVEEQTDLSAAVRVGGDLQLLKALISAGYPVIVEKGFEGVRFDGWMGHYQVVNGYDNAAQVLFVQDSYDGPNLEIAYEEMLNRWRAFNYTYMVIYPPAQEEQVMAILGPQADLNTNYEAALQRATEETSRLSGRDLFFAWFNRGTNLNYLHDYQAAATAYDAAFANYPTIPEKERPWRMLWYQTGPYFAYYYTGRYQDVVDLAISTLTVMNESVLEESYYWRGMARLALGETDSAIADFRKAADVHPGFQPALDQLAALGVQP